MNRLCILSCLVLIVGQITCQIAVAAGPIINAPSTELTGDSFLGKLSASSSNSNFVNTDNSKTLLTFAGNVAALKSGDAAINKAGFVTHTNYFELENGNILISPNTDLTISMQEGIVSVASGATIFIMKSGMDIVIYDLYQSKPNQVSIVVNRHKLVMAAGCMLVLTRQKTKNFEDLNINCHSIKYHKAQEINLQENTVNAFVANFSIFSALVRIQPLKQLLDSKDKRDQVLLQNLLRSAAMLRT